MSYLSKYGFMAFMLAAFACKEKVIVLHTENIHLTGVDQIIPIEDSLVRPVLYHNLPEFQGLPVDVAKEKFIATVLPAILIAKHSLAADRKMIQRLSDKAEWTARDSVTYLKLADRFNAKNIHGLLDRIKTHPNSIVLAQAAVESGWGSSRFFREANNLFGIWSYHDAEPRIQANLSRGDGKVYLRSYDDLSQSITDYFETIGRSNPYRYFRKARAQSSDIAVLLPNLKYYSERREEYVAQLKTIIDQNNLTQYDNYQLDPRYFKEKE